MPHTPTKHDLRSSVLGNQSDKASPKIPKQDFKMKQAIATAFGSLRSRFQSKDHSSEDTRHAVDRHPVPSQRFATFRGMRSQHKQSYGDSPGITRAAVGEGSTLPSRPARRRKSLGDLIGSVTTKTLSRLTGTSATNNTSPSIGSPSKPRELQANKADDFNFDFANDLSRDVRLEQVETGYSGIGPLSLPGPALRTEFTHDKLQSSHEPVPDGTCTPTTGPEAVSSHIADKEILRKDTPEEEAAHKPCRGGRHPSRSRSWLKLTPDAQGICTTTTGPEVLPCHTFDKNILGKDSPEDKARHRHCTGERCASMQRYWLSRDSWEDVTVTTGPDDDELIARGSGQHDSPNTNNIAKERDTLCDQTGKEDTLRPTSSDCLHEIEASKLDDTYTKFFANTREDKLWPTSDDYIREIIASTAHDACQTRNDQPKDIGLSPETMAKKPMSDTALLPPVGFPAESISAKGYPELCATYGDLCARVKCPWLHDYDMELVLLKEQKRLRSEALAKYEQEHASAATHDGSGGPTGVGAGANTNEDHSLQDWALAGTWEEVDTMGASAQSETGMAEDNYGVEREDVPATRNSQTGDVPRSEDKPANDNLETPSEIGVMLKEGNGAPQKAHDGEGSVNVHLPSGAIVHQILYSQYLPLKEQDGDEAMSLFGHDNAEIFEDDEESVASQEMPELTSIVEAKTLGGPVPEPFQELFAAVESPWKSLKGEAHGDKSGNATTIGSFYGVDFSVPRKENEKSGRQSQVAIRGGGNTRFDPEIHQPLAKECLGSDFYDSVRDSILTGNGGLGPLLLENFSGAVRIGNSTHASSKMTGTPSHCSKSEFKDEERYGKRERDPRLELLELLPIGFKFSNYRDLLCEIPKGRELEKVEDVPKEANPLYVPRDRRLTNASPSPLIPGPFSDSGKNPLASTMRPCISQKIQAYGIHSPE